MNYISAIVPAYNEEKTLKETLFALKSIPEVSEIIVVDDGSQDNTSKVAESCGVQTIKFSKNKGKGYALTEGIKRANYDIVLMVDADVGESAKEVVKLISPVLANEADMTIAQFPKSKIRGGFGLAQKLSCWGIKKLTGLDMLCPLSGQRCFRKSIFKKVGKIAGGFGAETALTIDMARCGFRILEVETEMVHRETTRTIPGFIHRAKQFLAVVVVLVSRGKSPLHPLFRGGWKKI